MTTDEALAYLLQWEGRTHPAAPVAWSDEPVGGELVEVEHESRFGDTRACATLAVDLTFKVCAASGRPVDEAALDAVMALAVMGHSDIDALERSVA